MTKEQEAIENLTDLLKQRYEKEVTITTFDLFENIETVLSMLKEKDEEIEKRDNVVRKIINRLDDDINRIAKSKQENNWDDYRRCRLKAYKTKTREIKEYIEEQYFENKVKE